MNPMQTRLVAAVAGMGLLLAGTAVSVSAHHAFAAEFDATRTVHFKGTITRMEWVNPHIWLHVDVKTPDGKTESWAFEAGTPSVLFRRGFYEEVPPAGNGGRRRWASIEGRLPQSKQPGSHVSR